MFHGAEAGNTGAHYAAVLTNKQEILCVIIVDLKWGVLHFGGAHAEKWVPKDRSVSHAHAYFYTHTSLVVWDGLLSSQSLP